jgi:hypothetical protein
MPQGFSYVGWDHKPVLLYIRTIIPNDMGVLSPAILALSGWGCADFHGGANFRFTGFSEVHYLGDAPRIQRYI